MTAGSRGNWGSKNTNDNRSTASELMEVMDLRSSLVTLGSDAGGIGGDDDGLQSRGQGEGQGDGGDSRGGFNQSCRSADPSFWRALALRRGSTPEEEVSISVASSSPVPYV